ncbi:hypothetical protein NDA12_001751 [Ustilago hordei]|nr:hypothetical protein NDA12_001751 [Ustilago hordei]KAJ1589518.1 hypothetical protein NDA15_006148 [Ustilago hordei]
MGYNSKQNRVTHKPPMSVWMLGMGEHTQGQVRQQEAGSSKNLDLTVSEALGGEDRKHWEEAMQKELDGLEAMGMWEIADLPKGANTIDTCWVLKIKTNANLVPTKFKARLIARGFMQHEGIDYMEVFAPVAPIQSI